MLAKFGWHSFVVCGSLYVAEYNNVYMQLKQKCDLLMGITPERVRLVLAWIPF